MAISGELLILLTAFEVYLAARLEKLGDIWPELDAYDKKLERGFAEYVTGEFVAPFFDEISDNLDSMFKVERMVEEVAYNLASEQSKSSLGEPHQSSPDSGKESADWSEFMADSPPGELVTGNLFDFLRVIGEDEMIEEMKEGEIDAGELDDANEIYEEKFGDKTVDFLISYMMKNNLLDLTEAFREAKNFYRRHKWPNRIFASIKISLVVLIILVLATIIASFSSSSDFVGYTLPGIGLMVAVWLLLELALWYSLSTEVEMKERTVVGKLLKPNLENFI